MKIGVVGCGMVGSAPNLTTMVVRAVLASNYVFAEPSAAFSQCPVSYSALNALITSTRDALAAGPSDASIAAATSTAAAASIGTTPGISISVI